MSLKIELPDEKTTVSVKVHGGCWVLKNPSWMTKLNDLKERIDNLMIEEDRNEFLNEIKAFVRQVRERFAVELPFSKTPHEIGWDVRVGVAQIRIKEGVAILTSGGWVREYASAEALVKSLANDLSEYIVQSVAPSAAFEPRL